MKTSGRGTREIFTVGHSTRTIEEFVRVLRSFGVRRVVDVRSIPRSRHNPQFNGATLSAALHNRRLHYRHMKALGGLRHARRDSINTAWENASFRGFADYMQTPEFDRAVERLLVLAAVEPTALMCAESLPWRCHRSLIADALIVRGVPIRHVLTASKAYGHKLTPFARVRGRRVCYPAPDAASRSHAGHAPRSVNGHSLASGKVRRTGAG